MYPALRALSVRDAARAWVLVDMMCLDATRRIEDDLVQRYAEDPLGEADWHACLTVDGCPACDTLWELIFNKYAVLRSEWADDAPSPLRLVPRRLQLTSLDGQRGSNVSAWVYSPLCKRFPT